MAEIRIGSLSLYYEAGPSQSPVVPESNTLVGPVEGQCILLPKLWVYMIK